MIPVKYSLAGPVPLELKADIFKENIKFPDIFGRIVLERKLAPKSLLEKFKNKVPFDSFFPSLQEKIGKRTCLECLKYHSSIKSLTAHKRAIHPRKRGKKTKKTIVEQDFIEDQIEYGGDIIEDNIREVYTRRTGKRTEETIVGRDFIDDEFDDTEDITEEEDADLEIVIF